MRRYMRLGLALTCAAGLASFSLAASAAECVRVAGPESSGEKLSLDPADFLSAHDATLLYGVYDRFLDLDDSTSRSCAGIGDILGGGGRRSSTWTFKLREGVKFHDGSDFDSGDVVWTFRRLLDETVGSGAAASILDFLTPEGIQAVDAHTVTFTAKEPVAEMPLLLTLKANLVVPEGMNHDDLVYGGFGTGPFKMAAALGPEPAGSQDGRQSRLLGWPAEGRAASRPASSPRR